MIMSINAEKALKNNINDKNSKNKNKGNSLNW